ncbi:hypothetical protein KEG38_50345 [Polyangium jinanense]|uniref:hypothetical protein n=1 Tax=Polyangium jinanense TaxID=2829994 RepID=UPI002340AB1A|nr:hypothetical protein [Polyangium jinanense]MDC3962120.1 hypothetical protein [Polyangium jinanense]
MSFLRTWSNARIRQLARLAVLPIVIFAGSCYQGPSCNLNFDQCQGDSECGPGFICDREVLSFGLACHRATECQTNADCPAGSTCDQRATIPADNPFGSDFEGKKVCSCGSLCGGGVGGFGGAGGAGGSGGEGGIGGAGGSGGGGGGGGGSGGAGGIGGAGGSGGAGGGAKMGGAN